MSFSANFAPNITGSPSRIMAVVGQEMEYMITATDSDGDDITFSLYEDITNATITKLSNNGKAKHKQDSSRGFITLRQKKKKRKEKKIDVLFFSGIFLKVQSAGRKITICFLNY